MKIFFYDIEKGLCVVMGNVAALYNVMKRYIRVLPTIADKADLLNHFETTTKKDVTKFTCSLHIIIAKMWSARQAFFR